MSDSLVGTRQERGKCRPAVGVRVGRLTIVNGPYSLGPAFRGKTACRCRCDCGEICDVRTDALAGGTTRSCGCLQRDVTSKRTLKHGQCDSPLYRSWRGMIGRCECRKPPTSRNYRDRGITVCDEWRRDFAAFRDWSLANGFREDLTLDRTDNDGNYEPGNCRWVTRSVNQRNRRCGYPLYAAFGETKGAYEWAADPRCAVALNTLVARFKAGVPAEMAITEPPWSGTIKRHMSQTPAIIIA